jgi:hypothetical protein
MPTVAHIVQKIVREHPNLEQFIERDLISFHRLAKYLKPQVEVELKKEIKAPAIVMALSRMRDSMVAQKQEQSERNHFSKIEVGIKSDALQIDLQKSLSTYDKIMQIQKIASKSPNDIISITQTPTEITIISSAKFEKEFMAVLKNEKITNVEKELSLLILKFSKDILYQPGFFDRVLRELSWENINVYEIVSTLTEFIIVLKDEDAPKAYRTIRKNM